jgi:hypothetical protein
MAVAEAMAAAMTGAMAAAVAVSAVAAGWWTMVDHHSRARERAGCIESSSGGDGEQNAPPWSPRRVVVGREMHVKWHFQKKVKVRKHRNFRKIHLAIFQPPGGRRRCLMQKRVMWNTGTMTWELQGDREGS